MTVLETLIKLRDDIKEWVTNNLLAIKDSIAQPDMEQNDSTAPDYVKNRLAWTEYEVGVVVVEEQIVTEEDTEYHFTGKSNLQVGKQYQVMLNDIEYVFEARVYNDEVNNIQSIYLGNISKCPLYGNLEDTGESFVIVNMVPNDTTIEDNLFSLCSGAFVIGDSFKISINEIAEVVHQIDPKYYERLGWVDTVESVIIPETTITIADGVYQVEGTIGLEDGESYIVGWNGVDYECICTKYTEDGITALLLGNPALLNVGSNTYKPFAIVENLSFNITGVITTFGDGNYAVSLRKLVNTVHKIDEKYIPDTIARTVDIPSIEGLATETYVYEQVENVKTIIVMIDPDTMTASMTASEIGTAMENGNAVIAVLNDMFFYASCKLTNNIEFTISLENNEYYGIVRLTIDGEGNVSASDIVPLATEDYVDEQIAAIPTPDVSGQIETHNTSTDAHADIREAIATNASAIELLTNGASIEEVDSVNDLIQYVKDHGSEVTGMKADIKANSDAIVAIKNGTELDSFADVENMVGMIYTAIGENAPETESQTITGAINEIHAELDTKADADHFHSYNDLTDKPTIPSIDNLATETYVNLQINTHSNSSDTHADIREVIAQNTDAIEYLAQEYSCADYITSTEVDTRLIDYATTDEVDIKLYDYDRKLDTKLANYYVVSEVDEKLADYVSEVDEKLADYYAISEVDEKLANYYVVSEVDEKVADYYAISELETKLYVEEQLDGKVDIIYGKGLSSNDFTDEHKEKIRSTFEAMQNLNLKFMNEVTLPVVELQTELIMNGEVSLTAEESENLTTYANNLLPVLINATVKDTSQSLNVILDLHTLSEANQYVKIIPIDAISNIYILATELTDSEWKIIMNTQNLTS